MTITWPDKRARALFFDAQDKVIGADIAEADGSAKYDLVGRRKGDITIVTIGPERYEVPDALLQGD